jgi:hypothetical protein
MARVSTDSGVSYPDGTPKLSGYASVINLLTVFFAILKPLAIQI